MDERPTSPGAPILIVVDFQHVIKQAAFYRALRDCLLPCKANGAMIVLVGPSWQMPPELEHDIPVLNDSLPSREELSAALETCIQGTGSKPDETTRTAILDAATGLTLSEAEGAMALSFDGDVFVPARVSEEKMKLVRQSGKLEVSPARNISDLGGLGLFKEYIRNEVIPSIHDPELAVRGIMLVGVPGSGKSLASCVLGAMLNRPVLSANIGRLKGSHQGESEANIYAMLKLAEAVAPCVIRLDECEKGVAGHASSGQTDGGVTLGMIGILLTWLEEHKSQIITIGTVNDHTKMPAEFGRAGRFDTTFFVGLPNAQERPDIASIYLKQFGCTNIDCESKIVDITEGWTGAEIAQLVRSAARRTQRKITPESLESAAVDIRPISVVRKAEIAELIEWGTKHLRSANTPEVVVPVEVGSRKIRRAG